MLNAQMIKRRCSWEERATLEMRVYTSPTKRWGLTRQGVVGQMTTVLGAVARVSRYNWPQPQPCETTDASARPISTVSSGSLFLSQGHVGFLFPLSPVKTTAVCVRLSL